MNEFDRMFGIYAIPEKELFIEFIISIGFELIETVKSEFEECEYIYKENGKCVLTPKRIVIQEDCFYVSNFDILELNKAWKRFIRKQKLNRIKK